MEGRTDADRLRIDLNAVEFHLNRLNAVSAGLVQTSASGRRTLLTAESGLHLALNVHPEQIELVKSACDEHADRCRG